MLKKVSDKLNNAEKAKSKSYSSYPNENKQSLLAKLTQKALSLYVKQLDIKNFTKLAMSDPENTDCEKLVQDLINNGEISDIMSNKSVENLVDNKKFLGDLGL